MTRRGLLGFLAALPVLRHVRAAGAAVKTRVLRVIGHGGKRYATLSEAIDEAAPGDIILVEAGHSETVTGPLTLKDGQSVIGMGRPRPRFTWRS